MDVPPVEEGLHPHITPSVLIATVHVGWSLERSYVSQTGEVLCLCLCRTTRPLRMTGVMTAGVPSLLAWASASASARVCASATAAVASCYGFLLVSAALASLAALIKFFWAFGAVAATVPALAREGDLERRRGGIATGHFRFCFPPKIQFMDGFPRRPNIQTVQLLETTRSI